MSDNSKGHPILIKNTFLSNDSPKSLVAFRARVAMVLNCRNIS